LHAGFLLFGYYFAFGSLGLPFPIKFPINVLFFAFFYLVAFGKIATADRAATPNELELQSSRAGMREQTSGPPILSYLDRRKSSRPV
jgi:hypothetical protein